MDSTNNTVKCFLKLTGRCCFCPAKTLACLQNADRIRAVLCLIEQNQRQPTFDRGVSLRDDRQRPSRPKVSTQKRSGLANAKI